MNSLEREIIVEPPLHVIIIASGKGDGYPSEVTDTTNTDIHSNMPGSNFPPGASGLPPQIDLDNIRQLSV